MYCIALHCIVLYCIVLYCIVFRRPLSEIVQVILRRDKVLIKYNYLLLYNNKNKGNISLYSDWSIIYHVLNTCMQTFNIK